MNNILESLKGLKYHFNKPELFIQAVTHKSRANENRDETLGHNERLEFLGDAVLDLVLSDILMEHFPNDNEGSLSKRRASLVNESSLAEVALQIGLGEVLQVGKGEEVSGGRSKPRILASALEALFGAIFLDSGYASALSAGKSLFAPLVETLNQDAEYERDFKTRLQEASQKKFGKTPLYVLVETQGPEHLKEFRTRVLIGEKVYGEGVGRTKKQAEQNAAEKALVEI